MLISSINEDIKVDLDWAVVPEPFQKPITVITEFIKGVNVPEKSMFYVDKTGKFYFIVAKEFDLGRFAEVTGYLIADTVRYNSEFLIGFGVHSLEDVRCRIWYNLGDEEYIQLRDLLDFTFRSERPFSGYPGATVFHHEFEVDGHKGYALHDYIPYNRKHRRDRTFYERMVYSLVYRMLCCMPHKNLYVVYIIMLPKQAIA